MRYLDRLVSNMDQINDTFIPEREIFIDTGTKMSTISIGHGTLDGKKIYIAKKIPTSENIDLTKKFLTDLWFIDRIAQASEDYFIDKFANQLPLVYGIELTAQGEPSNIITEDYSQRNTHKLYTAQKLEELHPYVLNVIQQPNNDLGEICRVGFKIGREGPVKLGDFDTHAKPDLTDYKPFLEKLRFEYSRLLQK